MKLGSDRGCVVDTSNHAPIPSDNRVCYASGAAFRPERVRPHGILWEGLSPLDGAPIVAIATCGTNNRKTGDMVQVWILRRDVEPHTAVRSGQDRSICGDCPMRSKEGFTGRGCYVQVPQAPFSVYRAYKRGSYRPVYPEAFKGRYVRWGAYGDPAMLPHWLVQACNASATGWTGYTHQWRYEWSEWARGTFMASVETPKGEEAARRAGWGTFRAGRVDGSDIGRAVLCPSEGGAQCADCRMCDGRDVAVFIPAHGPGAAVVPAERLSRR